MPNVADIFHSLAIASFFIMKDSEVCDLVYSCAHKICLSRVASCSSVSKLSCPIKAATFCTPVAFLSSLRMLIPLHEAAY